jgi:hypothetical protein
MRRPRENQDLRDRFGDVPLPLHVVGPATKRCIGKEAAQ